MTLHVGFTGTSHQITEAQIVKLGLTLINLAVKVLHHGDCVGADEAAHNLALDMGIKVCIHPPLNNKKRAFCDGAYVMCPPRPYIARNQDIVDETAMLIAMPAQEEEVLRSGTWSTVRYAMKTGKRVFIILPTGHMQMRRRLPDEHA